MYSRRVCLQCGRTYPWQLGTNLGQGKRPFSSFFFFRDHRILPEGPRLPRSPSAKQTPPSFPAQVPHEHTRVSTTNMVSLIHYTIFRIFLTNLMFFSRNGGKLPCAVVKLILNCHLFWRNSLLQTNLRVHLADHYPWWRAAESRSQKGQNGKGRRHEMRHRK